VPDRSVRGTGSSACHDGELISDGETWSPLLIHTCSLVLHAAERSKSRVREIRTSRVSELRGLGVLSELPPRGLGRRPAFRSKCRRIGDAEVKNRRIFFPPRIFFFWARGGGGPRGGPLFRTRSTAADRMTTFFFFPPGGSEFRVIPMAVMSVANKFGSKTCCSRDASGGINWALLGKPNRMGPDPLIASTPPLGIAASETASEQEPAESGSGGRSQRWFGWVMERIAQKTLRVGAIRLIIVGDFPRGGSFLNSQAY